MRVLIVEDDRALGLFLQKGLKLEGHETEWVEDGETALERSRTRQCDLMVLDLSLPRCDGIEVLEELRRLSADTAVVVLTGRSDLGERIRCLNLGADDCLLKPFSFHELTARCRAILRRRRTSSESVLRYGTLVMDLVGRVVRYQGSSVDLTPREFSLLETLLRRKGECCSREVLMQQAWKSKGEGTTNVVEVCVTSLRKKLGATHSNHQHCRSLVETVRGQGYRIALDDIAVGDDHPSPAIPLLARRA